MTWVVLSELYCLLVMGTQHRLWVRSPKERECRGDDFSRVGGELGIALGPGELGNQIIYYLVLGERSLFASHVKVLLRIPQ